MRTGRQTLASIEGTIARLHGEELRIDGALRTAVEDSERLRGERTAALRELARIKLDEIEQGRLVRNLDAAERRALEILNDRRHRVSTLAERREAAIKEVERLEADRNAAAIAVESALERVEVRRAEAEAAAHATPDWQAVKSRFDDADQIATVAESKATQSETELGAKKKPYDDDPLFAYLWKIGYSSSEYSSGNLARMIDRMIADHIGYGDARANYAMLIEIPKRLREHATERRRTANDIKLELAALERAAMVQSGIDADERDLATSRHHLATVEADLSAKQRLLAEIETQRDAMLTGTGDKAYAEALQTISDSDAHDDVETLMREARRTATEADEAVVRRISEIDRGIERVEQEKQDLRRAARDMANRRIEVERTRDRFRSAGYDHPHATFGNDVDIGRVLGQILEGVVRSGVLWDVIRDGFSTRPSRGGRDFGKPSFPFPFPLPGSDSDGPRGGGWRRPESRGGWSARRDDDDDDDDDDDKFRTGGRF